MQAVKSEIFRLAKVGWGTAVISASESCLMKLRWEEVSRSASKMLTHTLLLNDKSIVFLFVNELHSSLLEAYSINRVTLSSEL